MIRNRFTYKSDPYTQDMLPEIVTDGADTTLDAYLEEEEDMSLPLNESSEEVEEDDSSSQEANPLTPLGLLSRLSVVYQKIYDAEKSLYTIRQDILSASGGADLFAIATELSEDYVNFVSALASIEKSAYACKEEILNLAIDIKEFSKESSNSKSKQS